MKSPPSPPLRLSATATCLLHSPTITLAISAHAGSAPAPRGNCWHGARPVQGEQDPRHKAALHEGHQAAGAGQQRKAVATRRARQQGDPRRGADGLPPNGKSRRAGAGRQTRRRRHGGGHLDPSREGLRECARAQALGCGQSLGFSQPAPGGGHAHALARERQGLWRQGPGRRARDPGPPRRGGGGWRTARPPAARASRTRAGRRQRRRGRRRSRRGASAPARSSFCFRGGPVSDWPRGGHQGLIMHL